MIKLEYIELQNRKYNDVEIFNCESITHLDKLIKENVALYINNAEFDGYIKPNQIMSYGKYIKI